jgi:hypothetical protein
MNIQPSYHRGQPDTDFCQIVKSRNELQLNRIDYIKNTQQNQVVIYLERDLLSGQEVNAFMQYMNLVIEAPRLLEYERPVRRHLIEDKTLSDDETEIYQIGFSEVALNRDFSYNIVACRIISPGLLKINLSFKRRKNNLKNNVIN